MKKNNSVHGVNRNKTSAWIGPVVFVTGVAQPVSGHRGRSLLLYNFFVFYFLLHNS